MNIYFTDLELLKKLKFSTIASFKVGSNMYKTNNENSDLDYLNIYVEDCNSFMWEHHQLQFKDVENNVDENFTNIQGFIRNTLTGDSTLNLEVIFGKEIELSRLSFISDFKKDFINYNIIKSYLGMAKRDLKNYSKLTYNGTKNVEENSKKLCHVYRGISFATQLLDGDLNVEIDKSDDFYFYKDLKFTKDTIKEFENDILNLRNELNGKLETCKIRRFMDPKKLKELDLKTKDFISSCKTYKIDYKDLFYEALENGVTY